MRQVARRLGVQRGQHQERARLSRRDERAGQFAREVKAGIDVDRMHLRPRFVGDGQNVIGLPPRRRGAVHEVRHLPERRPRLRQQRVAGVAAGQVADPRQREFRLRRARCGGCDRIRVRRRTPSARLRRPAPGQWRGRCRCPRRSPAPPRARDRRDCSAGSWCRRLR